MSIQIVCCFFFFVILCFYYFLLNLLHLFILNLINDSFFLIDLLILVSLILCFIIIQRFSLWLTFPLFFTFVLWLLLLLTTFAVFFLNNFILEFGVFSLNFHARCVLNWQDRLGLIIKLLNSTQLLELRFFFLLSNVQLVFAEDWSKRFLNVRRV